MICSRFKTFQFSALFLLSKKKKLYFCALKSIQLITNHLKEGSVLK